MTLETAMCEWCPNNTPAINHVEYWHQPGLKGTADLCQTHTLEAGSDFIGVNIHPVTNKPQYTTLETETSPIRREYTVELLERAARYGAPYPVSGDASLIETDKMKRAWDKAKMDHEENYPND